jgi:hypothetical protein
MTSIQKNFFSAFCYQDIRSECLAESEKSIAKAVAKAQTLSLDAQRGAAFGIWIARKTTPYTSHPVFFVISDVLNCLPVLSQISGLACLIDGIKKCHGEDTNGLHSLGKGRIVRGIISLLNLGPVVLIADIAVSIFKKCTHSRPIPITESI